MSDYNKILSRAARLCSAGERCSYEIREKLAGWGLREDEIKNGVQYLTDNGFIDDSRYARFFIRDKLRFNKWGRIKLIYSMKQKQLSSDTIKNALNDIDEEEYAEILEKILKAKMKSTGSLTVAVNKAKVIRYAAQKGFTTEEIVNSLKRIDSRIETD